MALKIELDSRHMAPIAGGLKTAIVHPFVQMTRMETPFDVTFVDRNGGEIGARVTATVEYPTLHEFLTVHWRDAAPHCASIEEAHGMFRATTFADGGKMFIDDKPVIAHMFELR